MRGLFWRRKSKLAPAEQVADAPQVSAPAAQPATEAPPPVAAKPALRKALFLHIQKTAGSSFVEMARKQYGRPNVMSHGDFLNVPMEDVGRFDFISGHFGFAYAKHFMAGRYCFTFLREPRERLISLYDFCKTRNPDQFEIYRLAHDNDLEGFLRAGIGERTVKNINLVGMLRNNQTWQMTFGWFKRDDASMPERPPEKFWSLNSTEMLDVAKENVKLLDTIGFVETYEEDCKTIITDLGMVYSGAVDPINVTPKRTRITDLPASTLDLLDELTILDRQFYDYCWRLAQSKKQGAG